MKNWSLNAKIAAIVGALSFIAVVISALGLYNLNTMREAINEVANVNAERMKIVLRMRDRQRQMTISEREMFIADNPAAIMDFEKQIDEDKRVFYQYIERFLPLSTEKGRADIESLKQDFDKWLEAHAVIQTLLLEGKKSEAIPYTRGKYASVRTEMVRRLDAMVDRNIEFMRQEVSNAEALYERSKFLSILISVLGIGFAVGLAVVVLRALGKTLDEVIANLNSNSLQVNSASQQIAASSEQLSQASTEQAASLEQTASSIEEMNSMIRKNTDNASRSANVSSSSKDSALQGKKVVEDMIKAIEGINESNKEIAEIVKVISEIGEKTKVIHDIVFQTKLLSFNASVEAARAGEHGKGFAVVAEEVGNLAQMSGTAAEEIASMLEESIKKVEVIVNETKSRVEGGTKIAHQCGDVLEEIVANVANVAEMVDEIAVASEEQSQGIDEITKAMNQLDQVTQENSATSEESASAAEELSAQAQALQEVVNVLIAAVKGATENSGQNHARSAQGFEASGTFRGQNGNVTRIDTAARARRTPIKMASGSSLGNIPSKDDPRFDEL